MPADPPAAGADPAALVASVLTEEADRQAAQAAHHAEVVLPDDVLPGVQQEPLSLGATLRAGGVATIGLIFLLVVVEQLNRVAVAVLGPDIQRTLGISDTTLVGIASFGGVALVLGAVPLAWLADRVSRKWIVAVSTVGLALALVLTALVVNPFQLFWALALVGFAQAYTTPVAGSLISDQYPIEGRARVFAIHALGTPVGLLLGPFLAGSIADLAGGTEGWRWVYLTLAVPNLLLALLVAAAMREPLRGRYEQELVLGELLEPASGRPELRVTMSAAYQRMKKVRTFYFVCVGIGVLGFALVAVPVQFGILLEDEYGYGAFTRGWITSCTFVAAVVAIPGAGWLYDRLFRRDPEQVVRVAAVLIVGYGLFLVVGLRFDAIAPLVVFTALANACTNAAFVAIGPVVGAVAPYRLRAQAFALVPVFVFLMGGFLGGVLTGALSDAHGSRTALTVVSPIAAVVGGALFFYGSRFLRRDISLAVEELLEEQAERRRMAASTDATPALQVRNLDFSYGPVQVLFDVHLEVQPGEVVALLGTNGAGKSTLLRAISGLGVPDRGVVRLHGRTLTYVDAEVRFREGIVQLRGGSGTFPELSVRDNLFGAALLVEGDEAERRRRLDHVLELFPVLGLRMDDRAGDLSGGQQQMLALAMALLHQPQVLLIDELSLGLAPVVVQELLDVVGRLKAEGVTMVIVEQSLNVALAFADRAVFMEKGRVRFEGDARELLERDDLARAVFLGGDGG